MPAVFKYEVKADTNPLLFYQIYIFSSNNIPSKTIKKLFSLKKLIRKALVILEIFKVLSFFPFFPHFPDSKGQMEMEYL